jgi:energy-coupling factor transporter ATP-binding protein EcfA2
MDENPERVTYFAATDARGKKQPFGIKAKDRGRHMYVIGKTGMGKSTLLENMAIQDIRNGEGMAFIDPHGSAVEKLLDYIPANRVNDVVYFAPFDLDRPIAFNVMEDVGYDKRHLVVSGLMATFKKIWVDAWSARMEYILSNTLLALLEYPGATLLGVNRMYTDKGYRKKVIDNVKDPVVKDFWIKEFNTYTDRYTQEATPAIQNKIGQFTSNPLIRNIIGQPKSSFDIRQLMDQKKILIINLSKGLVGDTNMKLLGSMIVTRIFLGAMSRADLPGHELAKAPHFYFYVDEFQNFANETFAEILSEARKYQLNLVIAHQYVEQMEEEVAAAVFGNVGTTVAFRVGPFDAEKLEVVFAPEFEPEDLVNLGFAQIYLSLMIDGIGSRPFSAVTIPPIEPPPRTYRQEVIDASRAQFSGERASVESLIYEELAFVHEQPPADPATKKPSYGTRPRTQESAAASASRREEPRREEPRQQAARETRPAPREEERPRREAPPQKSAEDLKNILRATMAKQGQTKEKQQVQKQGNLKNALADVIGKSGVSASEAQSKSPESREQPKTPQSKEPAGGSVFEVPEHILKDLFKRDL